MKPLFFRILQSEKQTSKQTIVYIVTLYLKISSFFFFFSLLFTLSWLASYLLHKYNPCSPSLQDIA